MEMVDDLPMGKRVETEKRFGSEVPGVELDSSSMGRCSWRGATPSVRLNHVCSRFPSEEELREPSSAS